jgi:acyl-[acyl carrier protein]--UDP-N-acetylglucosamine O-acyltransferase
VVLALAEQVLLVALAGHAEVHEVVHTAALEAVHMEIHVADHVEVLVAVVEANASTFLVSSERLR